MNQFSHTENADCAYYLLFIQHQLVDKITVYFHKKHRYKVNYLIDIANYVTNKKCSIFYSKHAIALK